MDNKDTNAAVFELAIQIERYQCALYHRFSELFSHRPDVAEFWKGMEKDEQYHARTLESIRGSLHPERLLAPADPLFLKKIEGILHISAVKRMPPIKTLNDAYGLSYEMENSEFNIVFKFLVKQFGSSEEMKKFALAEIDKHLKKLIEFPRTFGDIDWRKSVRSRPAYSLTLM